MKILLRYIIPLFIASVLIYFTFKGFDLESLWISIGSAHYGWILFSAIPMTIAHISRARRWQLLLKPLNRKPSLYRTFLAVMAGYFANMLVPRLGEVTRCGVLQKTENIPMQEGIGTVVVERVFDLVMLAVVTAIALSVQWTELSQFFMGKLEQKQAMGTTSSGPGVWTYIAIAVVFASAAAIYMLRDMLMKLSITQKIFSFIQGLWTAILSISKMDSPIEFLFHTILIWAGYFFTLFISYFSLTATQDLGWLSAFLILVIGSFGMVAPVQGGVGAYHYIVTAGLVEIYHLSHADGIVAATLFHAAQTIYTLLIGGICALVASFLKPRVIN